jgi:4-hydroxybenzoate polyprenyltransferase
MPTLTKSSKPTLSAGLGARLNAGLSARSILEFLEAIKFSHSLFALPFALISLLLARRGSLPTWSEVLGIVVCMVGARTWAMGVNRIADQKFDELNPRTASRALPSGRMSTRAMGAYTLSGAVVFVAAAFFLSPLSGWLSFPVLAILASYSYTKRFTWFCHFWLGMCLGLAPLGAWVALTGSFPWPMLSLFGAITFWVGGFDVLYALQDQHFDRSTQLNSIPARFGTPWSVFVARISHVTSALLFGLFGLIYDLGSLYFVGVFFAVLLMGGQHYLTRQGRLDRINMAFFNMNGWIAVLLLCFCSLSLLFQKG